MNVNRKGLSLDLKRGSWSASRMSGGGAFAVFVRHAHVLTQRAFGTRTLHRLSLLRARPADPTHQPGLADVGLAVGGRRQRRAGPAGDRHGGRDWPKVRVLVDGADGPGGGGHRASRGGAGGGGEGPRRQSGGHLGGGQRT